MQRTLTLKTIKTFGKNDPNILLKRIENVAFLEDLALLEKVAFLKNVALLEIK